MNESRETRRKGDEDFRYAMRANRGDANDVTSEYVEQVRWKLGDDFNRVNWSVRRLLQMFTHVFRSINPAYVILITWLKCACLFCAALFRTGICKTPSS